MCVKSFTNVTFDSYQRITTFSLRSCLKIGRKKTSLFISSGACFSLALHLAVNIDIFFNANLVLIYLIILSSFQGEKKMATIYNVFAIIKGSIGAMYMEVC